VFCFFRLLDGTNRRLWNFWIFKPWRTSGKRVLPSFLYLQHSSWCCRRANGASEAQKALSGKRVALSCSDGTQGVGSYRPTTGGGALADSSIPDPGMGRIKHTGLVRAQGDSLCLRFKTLDGGAENCLA
jgi:hypothetical protein